MSNIILVIANVCSSFGMLRFLIVAWVLHIWGSIAYLAPGPDDAAFISQAMGFIYYGDLGTMYFERFQMYFLNFPGYAFFQALFYKAWVAMGLPLNFYTYKIFHLASITLLLIFSIKLILSLSPSDRHTGYFRSNLFLMFLGISPFVIDGLYPRPEPLGLLFVVLGMSFFQIACSRSNFKGRYYVLSSLCLGTAMTMHPTFVVVAFGISAYAASHLLRTRRFLTLSQCLVGAVIPLLIFAFWLWWHAPESTNVLSEHIRQRSEDTGGTGRGIGMMFSFAMFQHPSSIAVKIYYGICYSTLLFALIWLLISIIRSITTTRFRNFSVTQIMNMFFALAAFTNIAISSTPRVQLFTVLGFAAVLAFSTLLNRPVSGKSDELQK